MEGNRTRWSAAAKINEQPEKFYEGYSAAVMKAMQAFTQRTAGDVTR